MQAACCIAKVLNGRDRCFCRPDASSRSWLHLFRHPSLCMSVVIWSNNSRILLENKKKKAPNMSELSVKKWPCYQNNIESLYSLCLFIFFRMSALMIPFCWFYFGFCFVGFVLLAAPSQTHNHTHKCMRHSDKHTPAYKHAVMHRLM